MAFTGLSMLTKGWHHPGEVEVVTADTPEVTAVVEVRPTLRVTSPPQISSEVSPPTITGAESLAPKIVDTEGPQEQTGSDEPTIVGAENLVPIITRTEEE